ncbi:MAG TPA: hypothetical protein H9796_01980 [Candidatus Butyricimonas faecavium]|nr:hypothetical protein [Candidatus Butyricimonas faecavium]
MALLFNTEKLINFVGILSFTLKKLDKITSLMDGYDEIL